MSFTNPTLKKGDRVQYVESDTEDTGIVTSMINHARCYSNFYTYRVRWDNGDMTDEYTENQLRLVN